MTPDPTEPATDLGGAPEARGPGHPPEPSPEHWILARATANLQGRFARDDVRWVDINDPFVRLCLDRDDPWLVPLPGQDWNELPDQPNPVPPADAHDTV